MDEILLEKISFIPGKVQYSTDDDDRNYESHNDALFKVIIIGDTGVGKSCMIS